MNVSLGLWRATTIATVVTAALTVQDANASIRSAPTCNRADVGAAVAAASYGDTVTVPAGGCTWSSTLTITKGITLQGAGAGQTVITSAVGSANWLIVYQPDSTSMTTDLPFRITGFTFNMNNASWGVQLFGPSTTALTKVRIDHNRFENTLNRCLRAGMSGNVFGVIDHNEFVNCAVAGDSYGAWKASWDNLAFAYGSPNNLYWEDNTFTIPGGRTAHFGGQGGRYVARFNTYVLQAGGYGGIWDMHGNQGGGIYATMGCELYRNQVVLHSHAAIVDHRGGKCVIFSNIVSSPSTNAGWQVREEFSDSLDPTTNIQPQHVSDSYYWGNQDDGALVKIPETGDCCNALAENAQYFNQALAFNGSAGVGVGPLSSRPATCTSGVGYWATDQGNWNANGEDGVLYKCVAPNTWTLYYTPYTYPHPLAGGTPLTTSSPSAPQNLRIVPDVQH